MIIGYCRVSTKGQLDGNSLEEQQLKILEKYPVSEIFHEQYTASTVERPVFSRLIKTLKSGDLFVVTKLDRFCRSTREGLEVIDKLMLNGVGIHILNMGLIEDTPMGKLIVTSLLAFAEFERSMIIERTQSGKLIAKNKDGYKEGRPKKFSIEQMKLAIELKKNNSYREIEKMTGISKSTLIREIRKQKEIIIKVNKKEGIKND